MKLSRTIFCLLLICLLFGTAGCTSGEDAPVSAGDSSIFPVSGEVLSQAQEAALSTSCRARLYFITQKGDMLSAEMKLISFGEKEKRTQYLATSLVKALIAGPSNTRLVATIPEGTTLNSLKLSDGEAIVDFGGDFLSGIKNDTARGRLILAAVVNTLTEFKDIDCVTILYNGKDISGIGGLDTNNLSRNTDVVTDIENAAADIDYTENVFLEIELE